MNLFKDIVPLDKQHLIYKHMKADEYLPEQNVLSEWASDFEDRDNKFVYEFQSRFEPCLWELYLNACLKELNLSTDFSFPSPDFWVRGKQEFFLEATIAAPPKGGNPPYGYNWPESVTDFNKFNSDSAVRICNSFSAKEKKYRNSYSKHQHVKDKPFVIAIAPYDKPNCFFAVNRPIFLAVYGIYYDEKLTIENQLSNVLRYNVNFVKKNENAKIPVGLFTDKTYSHVSAVVYSPLVTWGKVRALAKNPDAITVYASFHHNKKDINPILKCSLKQDYKENLLDGLYILHNPFADHPLDRSILSHSRVAQTFLNMNGELEFEAPDDFLLLRFLQSVKSISN
jgi:hypothetical protein